jgi:hypothetical protein
VESTRAGIYGTGRNALRPARLFTVAASAGAILRQRNRISAAAIRKKRIVSCSERIAQVEGSSENHSLSHAFGSNCLCPGPICGHWERRVRPQRCQLRREAGQLPAHTVAARIRKGTDLLRSGDRLSELPSRSLRDEDWAGRSLGGRL